MKLLIAVSLVVLVGCAGREIIVDRKGIDPVKYEADLAECREYAREVQMGERMATSGVVGAAVGGAIGAIVGDSSIAAQGAGVGALQGATHGGLDADKEKKGVVRRCLSGRGYRILN